MSTIVAVKKNNQVVIGADTQISWGETKKSFADCKQSKLIKYKDFGVFGIVGLLAFDIPFKMFLQDYDIKEVNAANIFEMLCKFLDFAKIKHLVKSTNDNSEFFAAYDYLFATKDKIYHICRQRSVVEMQRFWSIGSGCEYALGSMESLYKLELSAKETATTALNTAGYFDIYSDTKHKHILLL